jgi:hypothetical protein
MHRAVLLLGLTLVAAAPAAAEDDSFLHAPTGARYFNCREAHNDMPAREVVVVDGLAVCRMQAACDVEPRGATGDRIVKGYDTRISCPPDRCLTKSIYKCMGEKVPTKSD